MRHFLFLVVCSWSALCAASTTHTIYDLTCEQKTNPMGVEAGGVHFSWKVNSLQRGFKQSAYQILVATSEHSLAAGKGDVWDSKKTRSKESVLIPLDTEKLQSATTYYWKVRTWNQAGKPSPWSASQQFTTGLLSNEAWGKAEWIALEEDQEKIVPGLDGSSAERELGNQKTGMSKVPQFRKAFEVKKEIAQALVYVSGLGHFELFLNGNKVGNHFLDPGWTQYNKEALYVTFDVTNELKNGTNALGVMLGNGFYVIPRERYYKFLTTFGAPKLKLNLVLKYTDGTTAQVVSDETWKTHPSPITYSSIFGGEDYDATLEQEGWMLPSFNDAHWAQVVVTDYPTQLRSQMTYPLTVRNTIPLVKRYKNGKGDWVYDLGQNFSGILRVAVKGEKGATILLRPAELLNADSTANQSASGDPFYFKYRMKGAEEGETWQPQFTYYGFRYVQLEGAVPLGEANEENLPEVSLLEGLHTCYSAPEAGTFICSKPMFNEIYELIDWAMRSNMASVLTDCPHREKLGWQEEAHLMQYSLQYRYNLSTLYPKILQDLATAQNDQGVIPTIAPEYVHFSGGFEDTPEWGSSFIISPWYIYKWYGDKRLLETHYEAMKRYLDYLGSRANDHIIAYGLGDWYDIGPNPPGYAQLTSNGVTATAIYYYDTTILSQIAKLLGKKQDAIEFEHLAVQIKKAFNATFFDKETLLYDRNSQTANAIALFMGLVEPAYKEQVLLNLMNDIQGRNNALTAGDIGYRYVLRALEAQGQGELIYAMNSKYDSPGYGWQLAHGATALTESWQAYGFVSNNHFMLGHLMEWLFSGLGGIRQTEGSVGYKTVFINPQPVGDVRSASTSYESPYGTILCEWEKEDNYFRLKASVPANSEAVICLPATSIDRVTEYGVPLSKAKEIEIKEFKEGKLYLKVGSGNYLFESHFLK